MIELILIRGLPGSVKTTIANLFNEGIVIATDDNLEGAYDKNRKMRGLRRLDSTNR